MSDMMYDVNKLPLDKLVVSDLNEKKDGLVDKPAPYFIRDGYLYLSCESELLVADYYGEFTGGYPYIVPAIEKWAEDNGGYWEWVNPGCIMFCK